MDVHRGGRFLGGFLYMAMAPRMITQDDLREINALVARFGHPKYTREQRREIYETLLNDYGVKLDNDGSNHAD
ncbi:MAG: hypothetical protein AB7H90_03280 [Alphaproteobacteria bacterium]